MIKKGIFISGKTYCLITKDNKLIKKAKGVKSNSLLYTDYERLLNNLDINTAIKTSSITDWDRGHVVIGDKKVTLKADSYKKRVKVYKEEKWVDTKPVYLEASMYLF